MIKTNESAIICHDFCVLCGDDKRAVYIKREKSGWKKVLDIVLVPVSIVAAVAVAPVAVLVVGGVYLLADKHYADKLGAECPNLLIMQFDKGQEPQLLDTEPIAAQLSVFTKSFDKMYDHQQKERGVKLGMLSWTHDRPQNTVSDLILAHLEDDAIFCKDHQKVKRATSGAPLIFEEGSWGGLWNGIKDTFTGKHTFSEMCMAHAEVHATPVDSGKLELD
jgi:hypothetical protein